MFNVGGGEVLVIALIALIVLGPQRLPDAARQVGFDDYVAKYDREGLVHTMNEALAELMRGAA